MPIILSQSKVTSGFTLIELLVVIFIIGIITTFVTINPIDQSKNLFEKDAERFYQLFKLSKNESLISSRPYAVLILPDSYQFMSWHQGKWQIIEDKIFRQRKLPDETTIKLNIQQENINLTAKQTLPQIIILPNSEATSFELVFLRKNNTEQKITISHALFTVKKVTSNKIDHSF